MAPAHRLSQVGRHDRYSHPLQNVEESQDMKLCLLPLKELIIHSTSRLYEVSAAEVTQLGPCRM